MSSRPFTEQANKYLRSMENVYSQETLKTRARRYVRMERDLIKLKEEGKVSTLSPKNMTVEDVKEYLLYHKGKVGASDMVHENACLRRLLEYCGNPAYSMAMTQYPFLKVKVKHKRKPTIDQDTYNLILKRGLSVDPSDFYLSRAYALVLMMIRTGTRNKEIRFSNLEDLDTTHWVFHILHVKGEDSYGEPRDVPIHPEIRSVIMNYVIARKKWLVDRNADSQALFPAPPSSKNVYLSSNGIDEIVNIVCKDLEIKIDARMCRRTFGQKYLDNGLDIESVSILMGHSSTKTTERFYSRKRLDQAMAQARETW